MKTYTVKDMARLSGVSVRTLHHYDHIGLLKPAFVGENRYRYYGRDELLRLRRILLYRQFDVPLAQIGAFLDRRDSDTVQALEAHRQKLAAEAERHRQMIHTVERAIAKLQDDRAMPYADPYKSFSADKPSAYERSLTRIR